MKKVGGRWCEIYIYIYIYISFIEYDKQELFFQFFVKCFLVVSKILQT